MISCNDVRTRRSAGDSICGVSWVSVAKNQNDDILAPSVVGKVCVISTFLTDVPRSRLVKYPLLFRNVLKRVSATLGADNFFHAAQADWEFLSNDCVLQTPEDHPDVPLIEEAIKVVEGVIDVVDKKTGEAKCRFIRSKLEYLDEKTVRTTENDQAVFLGTKSVVVSNNPQNRGCFTTCFVLQQRNALIEESNVILCDGVLKNNRGTVSSLSDLLRQIYPLGLSSSPQVHRDMIL